MLKKENVIPTVSIGMPVYNNKDTISKAIETILKQSFSDFEFIISDNASTDGTEDICRSYAAEDSRIKYIRQVENIGSNNFIIVFKEAIGEYFMWAPAHYSRSLNFIEATVGLLKKNKQYNFVSTKSCWINDEENPNKILTLSFEGSVYERVSKYLDLHMQAHACFYGLFRRSTVEGLEGFTNTYIAFDNAFIVQQLLKSEFKQSKEGLLIIGKGQSAHPDYIETFQTRPIHYLFPYYEFSKNISSMIIKANDISFREKIIILFKTWILNISIYKMIIRHKLIKILKKIGIYEFIKKNKK